MLWPLQLTEHDLFLRSIIILWPLSLDDDNWRSMFHTLGMFYHALSVVMRRWQLTEHVHTWMIYHHALNVVMRWWQLTEHESYLRIILPCSDHCHETMSTDGVCFVPKGWITMVWPLSWEDDNWQSRGKFNNASAIKRSLYWCQALHITNKDRYQSTSARRALALLNSPLISYIREKCSVSCHRLMTRSELGHSSLRYKSCSVSCHRLMKLVRA